MNKPDAEDILLAMGFDQISPGRFHGIAPDGSFLMVRTDGETEPKDVLKRIWYSGHSNGKEDARREIRAALGIPEGVPSHTHTVDDIQGAP